ncbi:hypothetical protein RJ45_20550 [Photobacterium gaetbulicola]|uniref:Uncharacterized protein n=1 Tax=Photobacterium gaetbulicola TaxID=1295392 RepID=A0A0B9GAJ3_9GAMM|nr:hypothetical protein RJ45_20550 [Photobacterium gaetbulicola]
MFSRYQHQNAYCIGFAVFAEWVSNTIIFLSYLLNSALATITEKQQMASLCILFNSQGFPAFTYALPPSSIFSLSLAKKKSFQ